MPDFDPHAAVGIPDFITGLLPDRDDDLTGPCPCGCGIEFINGKDARRLPMFHLRDGFYFQREHDGSVSIRVCESAHAAAVVVRELNVPANEWASVLASTCARGESGETYEEATRFLLDEK